jgi:capsular polysaccharide biosynthesis protein
MVATQKEVCVMEAELKALLRLLVRKSGWIVLTAALFAGAVLYYQENHAVPQYEAEAQIIVHAASIQTFTDTFKEIMVTPAIMGPAVLRHPEWGLTPEQLARKVTVTQSEKSQVIHIAVRDSSPDLAAAIVYGIVAVAQEELPRIAQADGVLILNDGLSGESPRNVSHGLASMLAAAIVLSVMVSVGLILLFAHLDDKIRTEEDVAQTFGKPVLGSVSRIRSRDCRPVGRSPAAWTKTEVPKLTMAGEGIRVGRNQEA